VGRPTPLPRRLVRAVIAWEIAALALIGSIAALTVWAEGWFDVVTFIGMPLAFGGVGAFLTVRVPDNRIGPLLLAATVGFALLIGSGAWIVANVDGPTTDPLVIAMGLVTNLVFIPSLVLILVGVPLLFPDGHFLTPRWRWVAVGSAIVVVVAELRSFVGTPLLVEDKAMLANPFFIEGAEPVLTVVDTIETAFAIPLFVLAFWSLVLRYGRADDIGRHQIRWLVAASSVAISAFAASFLAPPGVRSFFEGFGILALNAIPIAIGIAVVRYRLYDIDRLISRGISYAIVSALLLGAYVAIVLVLQGPLGMLFGSQTVTVAVSTLVVAALFQPVRRRVQVVIDRRFDRARIDAERTTRAFSERLRDEVDIDSVLADLASTAHHAVRPSMSALWLREPEP
jgi:hypothetical protein